MPLTPPSAYGVATTLWLGLAMGCIISHAGVKESVRGGPGPGYVEGELIIQLIPSAGRILDTSLQAAKPPTMTGLAWLGELNARYGGTKITPGFFSQPNLQRATRQ